MTRDDLTGPHNLRSFESLCRRFRAAGALDRSADGHVLTLDVDRLKFDKRQYGPPAAPRRANRSATSSGRPAFTDEDKWRVAKAERVRDRDAGCPRSSRMSIAARPSVEACMRSPRFLAGQPSDDGARSAESAAIGPPEEDAAAGRSAGDEAMGEEAIVSTRGMRASIGQKPGPVIAPVSKRRPRAGEPSRILRESSARPVMLSDRQLGARHEAASARGVVAVLIRAQSGCTAPTRAPLGPTVAGDLKSRWSGRDLATRVEHSVVQVWDEQAAYGPGWRRSRAATHEASLAATQHASGVVSVPRRHHTNAMWCRRNTGTGGCAPDKPAMSDGVVAARDRSSRRCALVGRSDEIRPGGCDVEFHGLRPAAIGRLRRDSSRRNSVRVRQPGPSQLRHTARS